MKAEHHIVILIVVGLVCALNSVPVAGLLLYMGITQAVLYCVGYIEPPQEEEVTTHELG